MIIDLNDTDNDTIYRNSLKKILNINTNVLIGVCFGDFNFNTLMISPADAEKERRSYSNWLRHYRLLPCIIRTFPPKICDVKWGCVLYTET